MKKQTKELMWDVLAELATCFTRWVCIPLRRRLILPPGGLSGLALITHHLWGLSHRYYDAGIHVPVIFTQLPTVLENGFLFKSLRSMDCMHTVPVDFLLPAGSASVYRSALLAALLLGIIRRTGLGRAVYARLVENRGKRT